MENMNSISNTIPPKIASKSANKKWIFFIVIMLILCFSGFFAFKFWQKTKINKDEEFLRKIFERVNSLASPDFVPSIEDQTKIGERVNSLASPDFVPSPEDQLKIKNRLLGLPNN